MTPDEEFDTRKEVARLTRWLDSQRHILKKQYFYEYADIDGKRYEAAKKGKGNIDRLVRLRRIILSYKTALEKVELEKDAREKYPAELSNLLTYPQRMPKRVKKSPRLQTTNGQNK